MAGGRNSNPIANMFGIGIGNPEPLQSFYDKPTEEAIKKTGALSEFANRDVAGFFFDDQNARALALNSALKDKSLDLETENELRSLYETGANAGVISAAINKIRDGKGIFAVRRMNIDRTKFMADQPGRQQIMGTGYSQPTTTGSKIAR